MTMNIIKLSSFIVLLIVCKNARTPVQRNSLQNPSCHKGNGRTYNSVRYQVPLYFKKLQSRPAEPVILRSERSSMEMAVGKMLLLKIVDRSDPVNPLELRFLQTQL